MQTQEHLIPKTDFTLAFLENNHSVLLKTFHPAGDCQEQKISIHDLHGEDPKILFLQETEDFDQEVTEILETEAKYYSISNGETLQLNHAAFQKLDFQTAFNILEKELVKKTLANNLSLIENIFSTAQYLKKAFISDRSQFFEELWAILKSNLGTQNLRVLYHDLDPERKEGEKERLVNFVIEGRKRSLSRPATDAENALMDTFQNQINSPFEIYEFNLEKGELTAFASINKGPVLIMANLYFLNPLQKIVLSSLFKGLQS